MSAGPEQALVEAIKQRLLADGGVKAALGTPPRLYDEAPPQPVFPYATVGEVQSTQRDAAGMEALEHGLTLHVYTRYGGRPEALDVLAALHNALHDKPLTVPNRHVVYLYASFTDVFRLDLRTTHAVLRLRAVTEPLS